MNGALSSLFSASEIPEVQDALVTPTHTVSWRELRERVADERDFRRPLARNRVGLVFQPELPSYIAFLAFGQLEAELFLMDGRLSAEEAAELGREFNLSAILRPAGEEGLSCKVLASPDRQSRWSTESAVTVLTSGSTGKPKAARHTWESLCRPVRARQEHSCQRWLQTYRPNLYAGLQVALQSLMSFGALVMPEEWWQPTSIVEFAVEKNVNYISATPSYWRKLLISSDPHLLRKLPLRQITLGGEAADQAILDTLAEYFPGARLTHIYATTELGRCIAVSDGIAGFPVELLERRSDDGIELKVVDGELFAKSANAMQRYDSDGEFSSVGATWFATGDLVEIRGDRAFFAGRKSEMINVGGNKVYPFEIERVIRKIPGVSDVRVFGRKSSISGQVVACELVAAPGQDTMRLKDEVRQVCKASLTSYQLPRAIEFVSEIQLSTSQKTLRSVQ